MRKNRNIYKKILILIIAIYAIFTLVNQQKTLNQYSKNSEELTVQINEQKTYNEELAKQKENVNSEEFIEQMAREKLDMYYPNEKVYVDNGM